MLQLAAQRSPTQAQHVKLRLGRRVPLDGEELQAWEAEQHASLLQPLDADPADVPDEASPAPALHTRCSLCLDSSLG